MSGTKEDWFVRINERKRSARSHKIFSLWPFMLGLYFEHSSIGAFSAKFRTVYKVAFIVLVVAICHFVGFSSFLIKDAFS
jgi:hypothetical protein